MAGSLRLPCPDPWRCPAGTWRGGPKPNRFAAQCGSTYFLDKPIEPWPETFSESDADRLQGWGCYLKGVWTDEQR